MNNQGARATGRHLVLGVVALMLAGCGGGGGGSQPPPPPPPPPPPVNSPPTANAGADQLVLTGASVNLSGSGTDSDGTIASLAWAQTAGAAVTLSGANTATPSFTAPITAGALEFRLTVTDNQGASVSDLVTVTVNSLAAPVIAFDPVDITAFQGGNALLFVDASGEDLSYEWHYTSGVLAHAGTEPYMLRTSVDVDHCYYVVVSNAAGSATSEPACIDVLPAEGYFDPDDDNEVDDLAVAAGWGNALLEIARVAAGGLTGAAAHRSAVPSIVGPGMLCAYGGARLGSAFDGQALALPFTLPIGSHSVAYGFDHCGNGDIDEPSEQVGAVRIDYDFPNEFGVGSYTMMFSGFGNDFNVLSGVLHVTTARTTSASGWPEDEIEIIIDEHFSAADFSANSPYTQSIQLTRRLKMDNIVITDATLDFDVPLQIVDAEGYAGTVNEMESGVHDLVLHNPPEPVGGEEGGSPTAEGEILVGIFINDTHTLGTIHAIWGEDWVYAAQALQPPPDPVFES